MTYYKYIPSGDSLIKYRVIPQLDFGRIATNSNVPTNVYRGVYSGFSLPVISGDNEYLAFSAVVPREWDQKSDPVFSVVGYIDTANDTKKFNLELEWEHISPDDDVVPNTDNNVDVETDTGASAAQYTSYKVDFTINYDVDTPDNLAPGDILSAELSRIAASSVEISGEFVVVGWWIDFYRGYYGGS